MAGGALDVADRFHQTNYASILHRLIGSLLKLFSGLGMPVTDDTVFNLVMNTTLEMIDILFIDKFVRWKWYYYRVR